MALLSLRRIVNRRIDGSSLDTMLIKWQRKHGQGVDIAISERVLPLLK